MGKSNAGQVIRLRGVRHNNLKNFDLDIPLHRLVVVTGLSGSGKSSLAFDTLFAEGQRRYIETFSPYARQFLDRMDKPRVDSIENIPPAIAIEQRNSVRSTRSTVGTMTEICDYMKSVWPHVATLHCRSCGEPVRKDNSHSAWRSLAGKNTGEWIISFDLPLTEKLSLEESLALVARQGYRWILVSGKPVRVEEAESSAGQAISSSGQLTILQDRFGPTARSRFMEAWEQACHFGKGRITVWEFRDGLAANPRLFSNRLHCARCDIEYSASTPALFSFNHPSGACPACRGFGRIISIDYDLAVPDRTRTLKQGVVKPWLTGQSMECQVDMMRMCRELEIPTDVPFQQLPESTQRLVIDGDPKYGTSEEYEWPRVWYGVKGYFKWMESKAYKMHVRVLLSRYRAYTVCPECKGDRLRPESLLYRAHGLTLSDFYRLPVSQALKFTADAVNAQAGPRDPLRLALEEVRMRLAYLDEVGLGYLTLDRPTRTLSGGETERVHLTTCLGTRLVNTMFVLDEPSVGLHPRDTEKLVAVLRRLRDEGNTVVVVEHEASVMRAADQIIDLGPGHGASGGHVVFQGTYDEVLESEKSITGQYLSGRLSNHSESCDLGPATQLRDALPRLRHHQGLLRVSGANRHNLRNLEVEIPLGKLVSVTGVSGSGKSTLIREVLLPLLSSHLQVGAEVAKASERMDTDELDEEREAHSGEAPARIEGWEQLGAVHLVDQSLIGKTPRSNAAVYIGAFDLIREVFGRSAEAAKEQLDAGHFSFNTPRGHCERCRGAGYEKIEMQFLSDVFIRCPDCDGRRFRHRILQVKIRPPAAAPSMRSKSIADILDATAEEAIEFLSGFPDSRHARNAISRLQLLVDVGLGYLSLGQPINTLSGGESQRLKLVRGLAESAAESGWDAKRELSGAPINTKPSLYLFDEPTTGLHFHDVGVLVKVFRRLVRSGHTVVVIEHNVDVIRASDWVIDLGPEAGQGGGQLVVSGSPQDVAACLTSHTGAALRQAIPPQPQPRTRPASRAPRKGTPVHA